MARNSAERLNGEYDLESRESNFSCTPAGVDTTLPRIYKCVIMLVLRGLCFPMVPCTTVAQYQSTWHIVLLFPCEFCFCYTDLYFLTSRIASLYAASARSSRVVVVSSRIALVICQRALNVGGYYRLTARLLEYGHFD